MIVSHLIKIGVLLDHYKCVWKSTSQTDFLKVVAYTTQLSEIGFSDIHCFLACHVCRVQNWWAYPGSLDCSNRRLLKWYKCLNHSPFQSPWCRITFFYQNYTCKEVYQPSLLRKRMLFCRPVGDLNADGVTQNWTFFFARMCFELQICSFC